MPIFDTHLQGFGGRGIVKMKNISIVIASQFRECVTSVLYVFKIVI